MKHINTDQAPQAIGPYSQAIVANGFVFCSGQVGKNPKTNELQEGIEKQTKQTIENLAVVLKEAGTGIENVVKTTIYLKNVDDFKTVNEIYATYFTHKPARATVEVAKLPQGALIEIDAIALAEKKQDGCCGNC